MKDSTKTIWKIYAGDKQVYVGMSNNEYTNYEAALTDMRIAINRGFKGEISVVSETTNVIYNTKHTDFID